MSKIFPVILSGGSGTRLWPKSRKHYPKQLLHLLGDRSMLQETALRVAHLDDPVVVCNEEHRFMVADQCHELDITPSSIILEPVARNTAPATVLAALAAIAKDPDAMLVVLPADHLIKDVEGFRNSLDVGIALAQTGKVVTFGVRPDRPETGYGYIKTEKEMQEGAFAISRFVEKPDLDKAKKYLSSGDYYWNSGMFVFKASTYLDEIALHRKNILEACENAISKADKDLDFTRIDETSFARSPDISIDYAVMEVTENGVLVPYGSDWSDLGSWLAVWSEMDKDENKNVLFGNVIAEDCSGSLFHSESQLIAAIGVEDIVVIDTRDAVLVTRMDRVQDTKLIVDKLRDMDRQEHLLHREVFRPWGSYDSIENGTNYQVKRIRVNPGKSLSLQYHHHRSEHWVVVNGEALVQIGEDTRTVAQDQSVYIPKGVKHRLTNQSDQPIDLIEVQSGDYLGEDDIVRLEDNFGRA